MPQWELSRMRVRVRWPTSARCNVVEYVLTGGWRMVLSGKRETREKTKEENVRKGVIYGHRRTALQRLIPSAAAGLTLQ